MSISLFEFFAQVQMYPVLGVLAVLVILVTIVAGATDAPVAIATAVATRCMSPGVALILAAIFNLVGVIGMSFISTSVAHTMFNMVDFSGQAPHVALMCLLAAMIASILWGTGCWFLGIPASKSHSLIAGITGGAIALNGWAGVVPSEWVKVIYGLVFSLVAGFVSGFLIVKLIELIFSHASRRRGNKVSTVVENCLAILKACLHGAQDGQKFMSIALLGISLVLADDVDAFGGAAGFPIWLMVFTSLAMSVGTLIGGKKIIKSIAMDMVKLEKYQACASSSATVLMLLIATLTGMPVSTSHVNTASIMGVGSAKNPRAVNWPVAGNMVIAWLVTFPCCGLLGFGLAHLFMLF